MTTKTLPLYVGTAAILIEALQYHIDNDTFTDGFTEVLENIVDDLKETK